MAGKASPRYHSRPKHSRSHRHNYCRKDCCLGKEGEDFVHSNEKYWSPDGADQPSVLGISAWAEPVLDTQNDGWFQYQVRETPYGKASYNASEPAPDAL